MIKKIIFFDTETNGTKPDSSVLSVSALKVYYNTETDKMEKKGEFDRFYFRNEGEIPNLDAIKVNGLTDDEIERRRNLSNEDYALTFKEDINNFKEFCEDAIHFVAHNIKFDRQFIPFKLPVQFDTMLENVEIVKIPSTNSYSKYKWPKLMECAKFYKIPLEEKELHNSMYDVLIMARVFYMMNKIPQLKNKINSFLLENISTRI